MRAIAWQEKEKMKLGSLFDGIAGFPHSARKFGITSVWASEIEPFPIRVSKVHFPEMAHLGDITQINGAEIEPVDVATGGSPCQDLSVAGKREGMNNRCLICGNEWFFAPAPQYNNAILICPKCGGADVKCTRSGLYIHQIRIIKEARNADKARGRTGKFIRPRFMVWENVPGALSSNNGEDFRAVLEEAARVAEPHVSIPRPPGGWTNAGCIVGNGWSIAWRILDAQYWGVPQRRRRIILVVDFAGDSASKILFEREGLLGNFAKSREAGERIAENAERSIGTTGAFTNRGRHTGPITETLRRQWHSAIPMVYEAQRKIYEEKEYIIEMTSTKNTIIENGICPTLTARMGTGGNQVNAITTFSMQAIGEYKKSHVASSCKTRDYKDATDLVRTGNSVRRLTPLECERLQGFPDGWTDLLGASDSARYKALGNSVAIACVDYVMEGIAIELSTRDRRVD